MSVNAEDALNNGEELAEGAEQEINSEGTEQQEQIDYEKEARDMGWSPEYNGPNKKSAKQYYEDGLNIQPILQANLRKEREKVQALEKRFEESEANNRRSIEALQKLAEQETERKIAEIQAKKKIAVKNADEEAFDRLEKEEKELLSAEKPEEKAPDKIDYRSDPVVQQWEKDNSWYGKDEDLTDYADFYSSKLRKSGENKTGRDFLDLVAEGVKKQFPDKFRNPRKDNFSAAAPRSGQQPPKTTSFDSLPPSAKRNFDYAVNRGLIKDSPESRQQYAKDFSEAE